ncbi:TlpA family protein disulfide reductase [Chitinophaga lutea]
MSSYVFFAQGAVGQVTTGRFTVGDTLPDILFSKVLNYEQGAATLSGLAKKKLIIDFWGKWCSSCIAAFPHLDEMLLRYRDRLLITTVTLDSAEDVEKLRQISIAVGASKMPFIVEDSILHKLIGPRMLPLQVWVDENRVIKGISLGREVNSVKIEEFISGDGDIRVDASTDHRKSDTSQILDSVKVYRSRKYYSTLRKENKAAYSSGMTVKRDILQLTESPIIELIRYAYRIKNIQWIKNASDGADAEAGIRLSFPGNYTYRLKLEYGPESFPFQELLMNDLRRSFGITGEVKREKKKYYVLKAQPEFVSANISLVNKSFPVSEILNDVLNVRNNTISVLGIKLEQYVNRDGGEYIGVVVDSRIANSYVDLQVPVKGNSLQQLNDALMRYELYLEPTKLEEDVLYIQY